MSAASPGGVTAFNIYKVGGVGGTNQTPQTISFTFNHSLDPNTITAQSVLLEESGGDGIFGNGNSVSDRFINLSGKLSFNAAMTYWAEFTTAMFSKAGHLKELTYTGVLNDQPVLKITVTRQEFDQKLSRVQETIASYAAIASDSTAD